jgi:hypothetical protein
MHVPLAGRAIAYGIGRTFQSSCGPWVPDLRSLTLARPGHETLVSPASVASALARAERDTDLGLARDRQLNARKSGGPDLRGPSAKSAKHIVGSSERRRLKCDCRALAGATAVPMTAVRDLSDVIATDK